MMLVLYTYKHRLDHFKILPNCKVKPRALSYPPSENACTEVVVV